MPKGEEKNKMGEVKKFTNINQYKSGVPYICPNCGDVETGNRLVDCDLSDWEF